MTVSMDVSDLDRLAARLAAKAATIEAGARVVVAKGAFDVVAAAQRRVPVDTGFLKSSIGVDFTDGGLTATIGPTAAYGGYVEYGTSRMAPRPYLRPAYDEVRPKIAAALALLASRL